MSETQITFFEWNYDDGILIAYERLGECNGCGDCCRAAIQFSVAGKLASGKTRREASSNGGSDTNGQGIWHEVRVDDERRFFMVYEVIPDQARCDQLTEDNRCKVHLTKPLFHKAYPMSPRHIKPFERCSYSFRELGRWTLETLKEY